MLTGEKKEDKLQGEEFWWKIPTSFNGANTIHNRGIMTMQNENTGYSSKNYHQELLVPNKIKGR